MRHIYKKNPIFFTVLLLTGMFFLIAKVSCDEKMAGRNVKDPVIEDIVPGDLVVCKEVRETVMEDPEFGADNMTERICEGTVTKVETGKIYIKIDSIADRFFVKSSSLWIIDESVRKPPPFRKGDIYECKIRNEEVKSSFSVTKINVIVKKKSSE